MYVLLQRSDMFTGLRIAHVRVLFKLPELYRIQTSHPLVVLPRLRLTAIFSLSCSRFQA